MCGIAGYYSQRVPISGTLFQQALDNIKHRGPDDEGYAYIRSGKVNYAGGEDTALEANEYDLICDVHESNIFLGHRRLAIIDMSSLGHQPMSHENLTMVFNGEIFNYEEIRNELIILGYKFSSQTDSEVFLKAYHCWGDSAFNRFNGMWAAAFYDCKTEALTLVRDRFGIKPLFYSYRKRDQSLCFSSEIKGLLPLIGSLELNPKIAFDYLRYCLIDHTNQTFFEGVYSLEAGCKATFKDYVSIERYYTPSAGGGDIEDTIFDSVKLRTRTDTEFGVSLSGGLDSSLITHFASSFTEELKSFTVDFDDPRFSERKYVEDNIVANDLDGYFVRPNPDDLEGDLHDLLYTHESPVRSLSTYIQYKLYEFIKGNSDVKVVLSGQGADEVFTGYTNDYFKYFISCVFRFKFFEAIKCLIRAKESTRLSYFQIVKRALTLAGSSIVRRGDPHGIFNKKLISYRFSFPSFSGFLKNSQASSIFSSPLPEYLRDEDRNSMRFSIEARLPFLDYRVVEAGLSLDEDSLVKDGRVKAILRNIARNHVPRSVSERTDKMGYVTPQEIWQKNELKELLDHAFSDIKVNGLYGIGQGEKVHHLYMQYCEGHFQDWTFIWRFFCFYKFCKVWGISKSFV